MSGNMNGRSITATSGTKFCSTLVVAETICRVPDCTWAHMERSLPNWPRGKTLMSSRPPVFSRTSSAIFSRLRVCPFFGGAIEPILIVSA